MTTKLIQKSFLKESYEYEIVDDHVNISVMSRFGNQVTDTLSVTLAVLNPDPVITKSHLQFVSRVNSEPLISLSLSKPNVETFNAFVNELKRKAQQEYNAISGINVRTESSELNGNIYEEPPEFSDHTHQDIIKTKSVNVEGLSNSINMLKTYVDNKEVQPLVSALEALIQHPQDHDKLIAVANAFNELGSSQGAVLTYAPYISIMLSDDPFGN